MNGAEVMVSVRGRVGVSVSSWRAKTIIKAEPTASPSTRPWAHLLRCVWRALMFSAWRCGRCRWLRFPAVRSRLPLNISSPSANDHRTLSAGPYRVIIFLPKCNSGERRRRLRRRRAGLHMGQSGTDGMRIWRLLKSSSFWSNLSLRDAVQYVYVKHTFRGCACRCISPDFFNVVEISQVSCRWVWAKLFWA